MSIVKKQHIGSFLVLLFVTAIVVTAYFLLKPEEKVNFSAEVKPIINKHCISCHGGVKKNGGFSLLFQEEAYAATESGTAAIIPGDAKNSSFIQRLHETDPELRMPYKRPGLSKKEIDLLTKWVEQGAEWGEHWAYTPPKEIEIPELRETAGFSNSPEAVPVNEIDHFIINRLAENNLEPNPLADSTTIVRRLSFDITGLPPDEDLFEKWKEKQLTYSDLIDSLLSKNTYGEKWASWWLDLARYADSKGYEKDNGRTMWRYRDWVIDAFNSDMPFDQFTTEQLAGDLLPNPTTAQLIATAFHRNTMNNDEGGTDDEEFRVAAVMDRVNSTFDVWQSTTISCVQCHSHPYDPFKHEEYYGIMGFFNNTRDEDTPGDEPVIKFYNENQRTQIDAIHNWILKHGNKELAKEYKDFLLFNEPIYQAHLAQDFTNGELQDTKWLSLWDHGSCYVRDIYTKGAAYIYLNYWSHVDGTKIIIRENDKNGQVLASFTLNKTKGRTIQRFPLKTIDYKTDLYIEAYNSSLEPQKGTSYIVWFGFLNNLPGKGETGYAEIDDSFLSLLNSRTPTLPVMMDNPPYMARENRFFERGNWMLKGDSIAAYTPPILNNWDENWPKTRLGLSKWLVSKDNPLTARTVVNRIWHQLFGRGLVATLEDMGTQSENPSHPELLDWLALRLMNEHNWQLKPLLKDIVLSRTYRQSSMSNPELFNADPGNKFYARGPRFRLSAEQVRDQALMVSGLMSYKMGGPSVMPPQPDGIWQTVYSGEKWTESKGEDKYRRGIYTYLKRTSPYPSFISFDAGSREVCTIRRTTTNTPLQALVTLNDPVYLETSYHLAEQMLEKEHTDEAIAYGYQKAMYRAISETKMAELRQLYETAYSEFENDMNSTRSFLSYDDSPTAEEAAMTVVAGAIMNLDEFLTKS
ncbi:PSD1 and planctomycete cytochrome C domain-containing protein [Zhouia spongiae]|uniref:PSD1 and planctomycete cytochrome C domain-containing protein n=1 Tax=Zhouia spongiae TaxID=2202721 RepID=A0ABY3YQW5_9FLAO|nr:PSD1 and planctomycete cytochrome C domain-containing protein [Zhouia spongiae]UNZ00245.1 PSD1 and planctomycete cytochrome C domain-containing protein [Zhouia spongiae]